MSSFDKAFAKARKSGLKEFSFGGKKYNTKLAKGGSSLPKSTTAVPTGRPGLSFGPDSTPKTVKAKRPAYSVTHDRDPDGPDSVTPPSGPSKRGGGPPILGIGSNKTKDAPFFPHKETSGGFKAAMKKVVNSIKMDY